MNGNILKNALVQDGSGELVDAFDQNVFDMVGIHKDFYVNYKIDY
jgi:hypothetical protein